MATKATAINYSRDFLKACKVLPIKIDKAILFGSAAKGTAKRDSDIDLALFSDSFSNNILENLDLIGKVLIHFPDLDIHTFPSHKRDKETMIEDEIKKGIPIKF